MYNDAPIDATGAATQSVSGLTVRGAYTFKILNGDGGIFASSIYTTPDPITNPSADFINITFTSDVETSSLEFYITVTITNTLTDTTLGIGDFYNATFTWTKQGGDIIGNNNTQTIMQLTEYTTYTFTIYDTDGSILKSETYTASDPNSGG